MQLEKIFGQILRKHRTTMGISQESLALECGLDRTFISALERGLRQPSLKSLFKIAKVLKVLPSAIIAEVESIVEKTNNPLP